MILWVVFIADWKQKWLTQVESSLSSFFFGKRKERDHDDKENQPELAEKRQKTDSPAKPKQRIRHESEGKYEQDSGSLSLQKDISVPFVKNTTKDKKKSAVWIVKPCVRRRRQSCKNHLISEMHKNNLESEQMAVVAEEQGQSKSMCNQTYK